jgi:hypothetical protein
VESWFGAEFNVSFIGSAADKGLRRVVVPYFDYVSRRLGTKRFLFSGGMPEFFMAVVH